MTQMANAIFPREYGGAEWAPYNHFPYSLASDEGRRLGDLISRMKVSLMTQPLCNRSQGNMQGRNLGFIITIDPAQFLQAHQWLHHDLSESLS